MEGTKITECFSKSERICSEREIERIYKSGEKRHAFPLLTFWLNRGDDAPARIVISVAKKRFHNAVDRNRIKRLIRAAYRRHKFPDGYDVAIIYISDKIAEYSTIEQAVKGIKGERRNNC